MINYELSDIIHVVLTNSSNISSFKPNNYVRYLASDQLYFYIVHAQSHLYCITHITCLSTIIKIDLTCTDVSTKHLLSYSKVVSVQIITFWESSTKTINSIIQTANMRYCAYA